jgi:predicted nuclease of predicted toxin-antitoxin system
MKLLVDMNLPPLWVVFFQRHGWHAVHWSAIGDARATDREIMEYARSNKFVVFTHDLDFGTILAVTHADSPSVLQVRTQDVLPEYLGPLVLDALAQFRELLEAGALITIDETTSRARILPINRS